MFSGKIVVRTAVNCRYTKKCGVLGCHCALVWLQGLAARVCMVVGASERNWGQWNAAWASFRHTWWCRLLTGVRNRYRHLRSYRGQPCCCAPMCTLTLIQALAIGTPTVMEAGDRSWGQQVLVCGCGG